MKRMFKSMVVATAIACFMAVSAFASPAEDLQKELLAAGVSSSDTAKVIEYLNKTTISDAAYKQAKGYINEAKALIGNTKDLSKLSTADKAKLKTLATQAGNTLGLNVSIGNGTAVVTDAKGASLLSMDVKKAMETVAEFNAETIVGLLDTMVQYANSPDKENFTPVGGQLTQTATPYANMMVAGAAMIIVAGGVVLVSKKQFA